MKYLRLLQIYLYIFLAVSLVLLSQKYYESWKLAADARESLMGNPLQLPPKQVVFIPERIGHPYWDVVIKGAEMSADGEIWVDVQGPAKAGVSEHIRVLERAIASGVDGIITQGLDREFIPVINKAIELGIPVITIDTDAVESKRIGFIGTDNYEAGYQAGLYVKEHFPDPLHIGIISGNSYGTHMTQRIRGFEDALRDREKIDIVSIVNSQIDMVEAEHQAYKMLSEHPEINLLFGVSALDGVGIAKAVEKLHAMKTIPIIAFDDLPETLELLDKRKIRAVVAQRSFHIGYKSIELMKLALSGQAIPSINHTEIIMVEKANLQQYRTKKLMEERGL